MSSFSKLLIKMKTPLALIVLIFSSLFLFQISPGRADDQSAAASQLDFPIHYQGEGITSEADLEHYLFGDTVCTSTAAWEITLYENGRLHGTYLNTDPEAPNNGECVSTYDRDHPSQGVNQIDFSGVHSDGYFEITESNLYYDYTHTNFRGHDKNIQGKYTADRIFTSPDYQYESSTYSNWTDIFGHEFDLPRVGGGSVPVDPEPDEEIVEEEETEAGILDDPGQDETRNEDSSGLSPLVPVAGIGAASAAAAAAAGGAAAAVASRGNSRSQKKQEQKQQDPCSEDLNRLKTASAQARALHDGIQTLRSYLAVLDTMHENVRQSAYMSASVDLALLGASIFTGPLTVGLTGKAAVQQTFGKAMGEAATKALGSELVKNLTSGLLEQGVSWESLAKAPYKGAEGLVLQNVIAECLTQSYQQQLIQRGTAATARKALLKGYSKHVASPLSSYLMNWISLVKLGSSNYTAAKKLEFIREEISEIHQSLLDLEMRYEDALSEMQISRSVLEKCRQMWQL